MYLLMGALVGDKLVEHTVVLLGLDATSAVGGPIEMGVVEHDNLGIFCDVNVCSGVRVSGEVRRSRSRFGQEVPPSTAKHGVAGQACRALQDAARQLR